MATAKKKSTGKKRGSGDQSRGKLVKIGALWLKNGANGRFMSGTMNLDEDNPNGTVKVLVFKNGYKEEAKHPDYVVYVPTEEMEKAQHGAEASDDDIPF